MKIDYHNNDTTESMIGKDWITNCMGVDISAFCYEENLTQEQIDNLRDKFVHIDCGVYYNTCRITMKDAMATTISNILGTSGNGILRNLGLEIDLNGFNEFSNSFMDKMAFMYSCLRLVPYNARRPEEYVYLIDAEKYTLNDLPDIQRTSKIMLLDYKKHQQNHLWKAYTNSNIVVANDDYGILIGQMGFLLDVFYTGTINHSLEDYKFVNSSTIEKPNNLLDLQLKYKEAKQINMKELIKNDYQVT
jgi:hypothetical protein